MAKKTNADQYLVQAYQSPYTQELFGLEQKDKFEKHLRERERLARERAKMEAVEQERMHLWATLRQSATCLDDVPVLLRNLPNDLAPYYKKRSFLQSGRPQGWSLTLKGEAHLGLQCITHESPLGQPTNWGHSNPLGPVYLLGLRGEADENLNYEFNEAKRESGIATCNSTFVLFADDWPFVAKLALLSTFDKTIALPEKYVFKNSEYTNQVKPEYTRFWEDIKRYSLEYTGIAYAELQGMRDALGLAREDVEAMMQSYAQHGKTVPTTAEKLSLPEGLDAENEAATAPLGR